MRWASTRRPLHGALRDHGSQRVPRLPVPSGGCRPARASRPADWSGFSLPICVIRAPTSAGRGWREPWGAEGSATERLAQRRLLGVAETMLPLLGRPGVWAWWQVGAVGGKHPAAEQPAALPGSEHSTMGTQLGPHPGNRLEERPGGVGGSSPPQKACQAGLPGERHPRRSPG